MPNIASTTAPKILVEHLQLNNVILLYDSDLVADIVYKTIKIYNNKHKQEFENKAVCILNFLLCATSIIHLYDIYHNDDSVETSSFSKLNSYALNKYLQIIYENVKFKLFFFGHHHLDNDYLILEDKRVIPIFKKIIEIKGEIL